MSQQFLEAYGGQSTDELIALAATHRVDSLVIAFAQALDRQAGRRALSDAERTVLAVQALEREVRNGGYSQFFLNSSVEHVGTVVRALREIGCSRTAAITQEAIAALGIQGELTPEAAEAAVLHGHDEVGGKLHECDVHYHDHEEPLHERLFDWIRKNRSQIKTA